MASKNVIQILLSAKDKTAEGFKSANKKVSSFTQGIGGLKKAIGALGIGVVVRQLAQFSRQMIDLARVQRAAEAQLAAAIKSTGGAANLSAEQLKAMASELQNLTNFGDEATIGAESLLLTFTNVGENVFPRALTSILDVSTAMNQDLKSSTVQIGKALNSPIEGLNSLSRVGIQFTEQQKEQIKTMTAANDLAGAQGIILGELERQFSGSAAAAREADGDFIAAENAVGDLGETIGNKLIPIMGGFNEQVIRAANGWATFITATETIKQVKTEQAELAAQTAVTARTQDELIDALTAGVKDYAAFDRGLIAVTGSFEEYEKLLSRLTAEHPALLFEIRTTHKEYDKAKSVIDKESRALAANAEQLRYTGLAAYYARDAAEAHAAALDDVTTASMTAAEQLRMMNLEKQAGNDAALLNNAVEMQANDGDFSAQIKDDFEDLPDTLSSTFKDVADNLSSTLSGAVNAAFSDMEAVVPGIDGMFDVNPDENFGRRMGALADGLDPSDMGFMEAFKSQAAGNPLYQGLLDAIEASDSEAVGAEATRLLSENLANVVATGAKEAIAAKMAEQNLMDEAMRIVGEEIGGGGETGVEIDVAAETTTQSVDGVGVSLDAVKTKAGEMKSNSTTAFNEMGKGADKLVTRFEPLALMIAGIASDLREISETSDGIAPGGSAAGGIDNSQIGGATRLGGR